MVRSSERTGILLPSLRRPKTRQRPRREVPCQAQRPLFSWNPKATKKVVMPICQGDRLSRSVLKTGRICKGPVGVMVRTYGSELVDPKPLRYGIWNRWLANQLLLK